MRRIVDLVSYQEGAVGSRIVVKRESGNVTLFAFAAGEELSEHMKALSRFKMVLTMIEEET